MGTSPEASRRPNPGEETSPQLTSQEIERKWLVLASDLPDLTGLKKQEIVQGYIAITADGTEVRVRQKGERFFQTIKRGGGLVRDEIEVELTKSQYDTLWQATSGHRIEKTRYKVPLGDVLIELDVYRGSLADLIVAEVEFASVRDSERFTAPSWFGREVTEHPGYKNRNLATKGIPTEG